ncbi:hypothetical protein GGX14DRAFT_460660 [Mycena pura]|uniref:DRBM domain-containing protein n=1 Tax=Mycena pura TaxID=153505 RepID=A0AAD6V7P9_9AGAR|nr:hypothetical protein GGX14DRAFT_460660 [Mycena pura]
MASSVTRMNNYLQSKGQAHLLSWSESSSGPSNQIAWTIQCKVDGDVLGTGVADTKASAREAAASQALQTLGL